MAFKDRWSNTQNQLKTPKRAHVNTTPLPNPPSALPGPVIESLAACCPSGGVARLARPPEREAEDQADHARVSQRLSNRRKRLPTRRIRPTLHTKMADCRAADVSEDAQNAELMIETTD
ncbi:hypothetical protein MMC10_000482 [Thelotrema lepadinum]|nr:hypothetical protein [Thelotrema lepadinum]